MEYYSRDFDTIFCVNNEVLSSFENLHLYTKDELQHIFGEEKTKKIIDEINNKQSFCTPNPRKHIKDIMNMNKISFAQLADLIHEKEDKITIGIECDNKVYLGPKIFFNICKVLNLHTLKVGF